VTRIPTRRILLGAALAMASAAFAQQAAPPQQSPEAQKRIAEAKARLKLTPEQESRVRALFGEEAEKIRALQAKYASDNSYVAPPWIATPQ
jgi:septal ring factor EnvC (AmiA/AmiB activator)